MNKKRKKKQEADDNPIWTEADFKEARPAREMLPTIFGEEIAYRMLNPANTIHPGKPTNRTSEK